MPVPAHPKIYHIAHIDKLASILADGAFYSDMVIQQRDTPGTVIGMKSIKARRLGLPLISHPGLMVGACVPFYFCTRSVMLYLMYQANHPELEYRGGQGPIVHFEADLHEVVEWAQAHDVRWAFTLSNAGSRYFEDRSSLDDLGDIDWDAVEARQWSGRQEAKQAEFLIEESFPWNLIRVIGVRSREIAQRVAEELGDATHRPPVQIRPDWYY